MRLNEWIEKNWLQKRCVARELGIQKTYLSRLLRYGTNNLRIAIKIQELTNGQVKCKDLLPTTQASPKKQASNELVEEEGLELNKTYADSPNNTQDNHDNDSDNEGS